MYYHIIVETGDDKLYEFDNSNLDRVLSRIVEPFVSRKNLKLNWEEISTEQVSRIAVKKTDIPIGTLRYSKQRTLPRDSRLFLTNEMLLEDSASTRDITSELLKRCG